MKLNIKKLRVENGYSQRGLAVAVGVSLVTIQNWEAKIGTPNEENMKKLKNALNIEE